VNRNWDKSFDLVIGSEGGFTDNVNDPGGATKWGCTKATWEKWTNRPVTIEDMKNLTKEQVKPLYKARYWNAIYGDALPSGLDYCIFDAAINSGVFISSEWIQEIVGTPVDGAIGINTVAAISQINPITLINEFCDKRMAFLETRKTFPVFGNGWTERVKLVRNRAIEMVT
jgi:lysozyme family protein